MPDKFEGLGARRQLGFDETETHLDSRGVALEIADVPFNLKKHFGEDVGYQ
jgi:hypothetical protein